MSLSNPIHFISTSSFLLNVRLAPRPTVILRKVLDCGHSYLKATLLAPASYAVVLADARPVALFALASLAIVLGDTRPAALLVPVSMVVVLADA